MVPTRVKGSPVLSTDVIGVMSLVDFPSVVGDGATDVTAAFQAVLDQSIGKILLIPEAVGPYRIGTIDVPSNVTLIMEPDVTFFATADIGENDPMFRFDNTSDVTIYGNGALITMGAIYTEGEQRHCLDLGGAFNITLDGLRLDGAGGDGVRLRQTFTVGPDWCDTIRIQGCAMTQNRRQGLSITSARNVWVDNCQIEDTTKGPAGGTGPGFGVDIEPNFASDEIENINITNLHTENNGDGQGGGITLTLSNFNNLGKRVTVKIENHTSIDDFIGFRVTPTENGSVPLGGQIVYAGGTIIRSQIYSIAIDGWSSQGPPIILDRPNVIDANESNSASSVFGAGLFVGRSLGAGGAATIGNVKIFKPDIFDQRATAQMTTAMMLKDFDVTDALREVNVIDPIRLGWLDSAKSDLERIDFRGTGTFQDGLDRARYSLDASFTLAPEVYTPTFDNALFTNLRNVTLSDDFPGRAPEIQFETVAEQTLRITAGPTSTIEPGVGIGGFIQSRRVGSTLRLRRLSPTAWRVVGESGAWFRQGEGTELDSFVHTGTINPTLLTNIVIFPGDGLKTGDSIRFYLAGSKGGGADGVFVRPIFGGNTIFSFSIDPTGTEYYMEGYIYRIGSSVRYSVTFQTTPASVADLAVVQTGTLAVDMSLDQDLSIQVQLNNAADSITRLIWHREIRINQPE